jgi:hypothetical protein
MPSSEVVLVFARRLDPCPSLVTPTIVRIYINVTSKIYEQVRIGKAVSRTKRLELLTRVNYLDRPR